MVVNEGNFVQDALYRNPVTGEVFKFLGVKSRTVVLQPVDGGHFVELPHEDFFGLFEDTGVHDHVSACCVVHGTHSSPHKGCLLR
jgi:hypothetical protein